MTDLITLLGSDYPMALFAGMLVNVKIALISLVLGLALGIPAVLPLVAGRGWQRVVRPVIGLMRAAPTFVVMFFLLNIIPRQFEIWGLSLSLTAEWIVALSLVPYAVSYVADNGKAAIMGLRNGSRGEALLFLLNLVRAFIVLGMSSSAGVAIGVNEGVAVVLREAEKYPEIGGQMLVFAVGVLAFGAVFQVGFAGVRLMVRRLSAPRAVARSG